MKLRLYQFFLAFAEFDLAIAEATGRNPVYLNQLRADLAYWQGQVDRELINQRFA